MNTERPQEDAGFFFDQAFEGMVVTQLENGVVVAANDAWLELTGYERDEVLGHRWSELHLTDEPETRALLGADGTVNAVSRHEVQIRTRSGEFLLVALRSRIVDVRGRHFILSTASDMTAERRLLQELERSRADLAKAQTLARVGSYALDLRTNEVLLSDELLRLLWIDPAGFGGTLEDVLKRLHPDDVKLVGDAIRTVVEEHTVASLRVRVIGPDGGIRWLQSQGEVELDAAGHAARVLGTGQDVTEQVRLEEESRRLMVRLVELREADRREIAHEVEEGLLQTLTALTLRIETAAEHTEDPDARYELAQVTRAVQESIERLRGLAFEVRPSALNHGIVAAVEDLASRMLAAWHLDVDVEDAAGDALSDDARAAVYRFLREALAALAPGVAMIRISVEDDLVVEVRHRGPGGPLDDAERPLLQEAAELVGGTLEIETADVTRVRLRLPDADSLPVER